jgi:hypothetical protein
MTDISNTIIQVVQKQDESAPDSFTYNDGSNRSEIIRYTAPLLLEIYPETNPSLLLPKNVFLINPFNVKQLIPADEYYEFIKMEEIREINNIAPRLGAVKVEALWEKDNEEKSTNKQEIGGELWIASGKHETKEVEENKWSKNYSQKSGWAKQKPDFEFFESDEFKEKYPIIYYNDDLKLLIDSLKSGKDSQYYEIHKTEFKSNIRQFEQMFKFAIPYLGFACNIRKNYEKVTKENYYWKLTF